MGLFDGKKVDEIETIIRNALNENPILEYFLANFTNCTEDNLWMINVMSYYDTRKRSIIVTDKSILCVWHVDDTTKQYGVRYTDLGFCPIHEHQNEKGKVDIPTLRVVEIWASLIREHLINILLMCEFSDTILHTGHTKDGKEFKYYEFEYTIPPLPWKDWF